jgi:hypothetical protein
MRMGPSPITMAMTGILATIRRLAFGARVRYYVDGREVPNFREGATMAKPKEKIPMGKGKGKGKGPKC